MSTTTEPNSETKPMTAAQYSASLLAKSRKELLDIANGLNLTLAPTTKNHEIIAAIMSEKTEAGDFAQAAEPEKIKLAPKLEAALDEIIFQIPAPAKSPTSDAFISALHLHYSTADAFAPFKAMPDCMTEIKSWNDATKPTTKFALLADVELLPPEKLLELKKLAAEHAAAVLEQIKFSPSAALRDYDAQRTNLHQVAADRAADISDIGFRQREEIQHEYHEKCAAIAERMKLIVKAAYPLAKESICSAENALENFLRSMEESERETAIAYDLEWQPSHLWKTAAANLLTLRNKIKSFSGRPDQGPEQMLAGLVAFNI